MSNLPYTQACEQAQDLAYTLLDEHPVPLVMAVLCVAVATVALEVTDTPEETEKFLAIVDKLMRTSVEFVVEASQDDPEDHANREH